MNTRAIAALIGGLVLVAALASTRTDAYPWTINHGYVSCAACHVDPSGAGQVTAYGRAMSDLLVRWHWDPADLESGEPSPTSGFMFGLVPMPEWFDVSGNLRGGGLASVSNIGGAQGPNVNVFPLLMATDLRAALTLEPVVVHASVGFGLKRMGPATVISPDGADELALVSREHWVGFIFLDGAFMARAGRMPLPFGLRNNEHTSFVRDTTRTDVNVDQQHGVALHYANDFLRAEVMGIAGNFQIRPDAYRERGYSGYAEVTPTSGVAVGVSSLLTYAQLDVETLAWRLRQAHGAFARFAPSESVVVMAEADALVDTADAGTVPGGVLWTQLDWQPLGGIHVMPAVEARHRFNGVTSAPDLGAWASAAWYALPHTELRADAFYREVFPATGPPVGSFGALLQLHLFL